MTMESDLFGKVERGAEFSPCGRYRYSLWRKWGEGRTLAFIMLNPSTADADKNDPTVERCERRARAGGFGGVHVANLMAYRATDPKELSPLTREERFGEDNAMALVKVLDMANAMIVVAWGAHGHLGPVAWLSAVASHKRVKLWCLGTTAAGLPRHPLYVAYEQPFVEWKP